MKRLLIVFLLIFGCGEAVYSQQQLGGGGGGSFSKNVVQPDVVTTLCPGCTAKADAKWSFIANIPTNTATPTITCADCKFTTTPAGVVNAAYYVAADVEGTCCGTGAGNHITSVLVLPVGTITAVNSATSITVSTNSNASASGAATNTLAFGHNDSAALKAAFDAAWIGPICSGVQLPSGGMMVNTNFDSNVNNGCNNGLTASQRMGAWVSGYGRAASILIMESNFNFATQCTGINLGANGPGCLFSVNGIQLERFGVWGMEFGNTAVGSPFTLITLGPDTGTLDFDLVGWAGADGNVAGLGFTLPNIIYTNIDGAGSTSCVAQSSGFMASMDTSFCGDGLGTSLFIQSGGGVKSHNSAFGFTGQAASNEVQNNGLWESHNDQIVVGSGGNGSSAVRLNIGSTSWIDGLQVVNTSATGNIGIDCTQCTAFIANTKTQGGATGSDLSVSSTGTVTDKGGNTYGSNRFSIITSGVLNPYRRVIGACTGVGTAASTLGLFGTGPNVTLTTCTSATIGTGIVADHAGNIQALQVTATAAGTNASSGVVTVLKNAGATAVTCTVGTGTLCSDGTHTVAVAKGDLISIQFTTQAADTLAGVKAVVSIN